MKYKNMSAFLLLAITFSVTSFSQDLLSKEEAISQMLVNNFGIKIAENQVEVADNNQSVLNSGYLPTLTGNANAQYDRSNETREFPGAFNEDGSPRPNTEIEGAESQSYNASLNVNYLLFDGLGRFYNYKQLKETYNLTELQARETIENTTLQLFSVYFDVARLTENLEVFKQALEISQKRVTRSQYGFDYGQSTKLEVLQAEVDVVTDSVIVLNAKQQLLNAKRDLNVVLNRELETIGFQVDTLVEFENDLLLESFVEKAEFNNVTLLQAESQTRISDFEIKANKALLLPSVGLTGSYGWNRVNSPASAFFPGSVSRGNNLTVGANLTWNLFDGGRSIVGIKNAKILNDSQKLQEQQFELQVNRDIANALGNYRNLLKIYKIQEQNVETNQNNLERSRERLNLGQISSIEFRQAQINLINVQTNKNLAKYDAKLAELELLRLTGQLLNVEF
ncbi:TolC family protein [Croceibacter atlanticus]|uniref:Putative outer membrane protein TolC n=1 Tax=Croceibacter atlanticus (strain ATCC BAA-628 / JCM 21780 / CIP 108009 / IAM 15332 / KCTC 12090 / HTCC2559) TaxID=216432 RepID=A3U590_CROAH|nr:putative outer membrane protein TolC [Croceibacter atlanticus HTCC2559]MBW4970359.1 TolC family protein [Croceibacter atlanticus]